MTASATPILDRELPLPRPQPWESPQAPVPKSPRNTVIGTIFVVLAVVSIVFLATSSQWIAHAKAPLFGILYLVLTFLFALFMAIVIHELGHLTAGWCVGFRFLYVRFGPIEITPPFRVSLGSSFWRVASGRTQMEPTRFSAIRVRMFVMIVGGCIANLASGLTIVMLPYSSFFLAALAMVSFFLGIGNLLPLGRADAKTDGKRILSLLWPNAEWKRMLAMKQIAAELKKGVSPEKMRPGLISSAIGVVDNSPPTFIAHWVAYRASWDKGPEVETARRLEIALQSSAFAPSSLRETLPGDAACFQAMKRKNAELAGAWLAEIPETSSHFCLRLWVESGIFEVQNDLQAALHKLDEIEKHMQAPNSDQRWSKSLLQRRSELQARLGAGDPAATTTVP